ncbi:hypothetical protein MKZ08_09760 [Viridibacillus sp. FSL R5-0477]|uniref:Peptide ABC transporter permease n=1 Tax=Viridibacillus arenosi FSL R5-213 TaxID=1227360 RepID=W4F1J7_9BACL|nr:MULTISPECIES: hypothetical protein [Viridibacillus]ETT86728.1 hypothetical protein C176_08447 [Viridibacillus arenosi FSL R5-213]OMC84450.1 hypothetical protein BK128_16290 [Viridibacillus sp. FSL H7-0596]OMC89503.1 hypothetical protein BK137_17280 [Viridibacillus arenosi]
MTNYLNRIIQELVEENLENYWPGFEMVAYALYDNCNVYLYNHPKFKGNKQNTYQILKRDEQFNGCTLILYEEYPTAIVDLQLYGDYESLFSILVHELFHGYQYIKGENRFPDELLGVTYPLSNENVQLRNLERMNLYNALLEKNTLKKKEYLNTFIELKEKRAAIINDYLIYENLIESVEGPAWYVELKAYEEKSSLEYGSVLQNYGQSLINKYESTSNIRRSCYSSGLFMCLLLDELSPGWKEDFFGTEETLYDFFKRLSANFIKSNLIDYREIEISSETEEVIIFALENRKKEFKKFNEQKGILLSIEGEITAKSFDPMNIIFLEEKLLHKNFIKVRINNEDYLIQQHVITDFKGRLQDIKKLHLILKDKPIENIDSLVVEGVGEIKGRYLKRENNYHLFVNKY